MRIGELCSQTGDLLTNWVTGALSNSQKQALLADQIQKIDTAMDELQRVRTYLNQKVALCVEAFAEEEVLVQ